MLHIILYCRSSYLVSQYPDWFHYERLAAYEIYSSCTHVPHLHAALYYYVISLVVYMVSIKYL